ncbi:MAG TPA: hypothetical protein VNJ08_13220 [Bacteriovoracaceae bacterium]|nr:hypothetical protein [Bacteriovoracaceae bacterium]
MITVLLSAFNEKENPFFWTTLNNIHQLQLQGHKIDLVVGISDGGDGTLALLEQQGIRFVNLSTSMRSRRYNFALAAALCGPDEWILLHHPRSLLDPEAFINLQSVPTQYHWGAFTHQFDINHPFLSFTSWWSNQVRGQIKGIYYLDHCIFIKRKTLEKIGGVPEVDIFEDTLLSLCLNEFGKPLRLPNKSTTSSIRFKKNGFLRQSILNQVMKFRYYLNHDKALINKAYEKGISLNTEFK